MGELIGGLVGGIAGLLVGELVGGIAGILVGELVGGHSRLAFKAFLSDIGSRDVHGYRLASKAS